MSRYDRRQCGLIVRRAFLNNAPQIVNMIKKGAAEGAFHHRTLSVVGFCKYAFEQPREGYSIFLCQIGDRIAGYVDSRIKMGVGHILGIYVKPKYRRQGVGTALMERTINEFRMKGCHKTRLEVFADNQAAKGFYTSLGFAQEGFLLSDEERKNIIIMSKFLARS